MRQLLELTKRGAALLPGRAAASAPPMEGANRARQATEPEAPAPKPPPGLPLAFMLSHLEDDGPVRLDRQKLGVCEVLGLELDEPRLGVVRRRPQRLRLPAATARAPAPARARQAARRPRGRAAA